ncbi:hypothetical protein BO99DRAFT_398353 [Aspergillus violaceofuscus CBS 115571]|uniref:Uncharacterized protein n=1 Tax=Aspergillus violaceofuscus (strain CBS 115571) TaxID=1450538 RepID=A0A2V5HQ87_ASPV1|nr:hypothetical protein BO99DRAFT_398353 [Aspergillus violaceofuscus CBS 115571]
MKGGGAIQKIKTKKKKVSLCLHPPSLFLLLSSVSLILPSLVFQSPPVPGAGPEREPLNNGRIARSKLVSLHFEREHETTRKIFGKKNEKAT